jgi:hypothetical protein
VNKINIHTSTVTANAHRDVANKEFFLYYSHRDDGANKKEFFLSYSLRHGANKDFFSLLSILFTTIRTGGNSLDQKWAAIGPCRTKNICLLPQLGHAKPKTFV